MMPSKRMTAVEEANDLRFRIISALDGLGYVPDGDYLETEVEFRYASIRGMLIMAKSDVEAMIKSWEKTDSSLP